MPNKYCTQCGYKCDINDKFCASCGNKLPELLNREDNIKETDNGNLSSNIEQETNIVNTENNESNESNKETKQCPFCGKTINVLAKKCRFCGKWFEEPQTEEKINCPACGEEILKAAKKCKHCGEWINRSEVHSERAVQNVEDNDDLVKGMKTIPNLLMIFLVFLIGVVAQYLWLVRLKNGDKEGNVTRLNKMAGYNGFTLPKNLIITLMILSVAFVIIMWRASAGIGLLLLCINSIILSIFEIKYAKNIEEYTYQTQGMRIKCNRIWTFILQSIYLNYFFLTYNDRLEKARNFRG